MARSNYIPKVSLVLLAITVGYLFVISGQPRMADGALSGEEMYVPEKLLTLAVPLSVVTTVILGATRAARAGSWPWFLGCIFVWPLSHLYTLAVNRGDEA